MEMMGTVELKNLADALAFILPKVEAGKEQEARTLVIKLAAQEPSLLVDDLGELSELDQDTLLEVAQALREKPLDLSEAIRMTLTLTLITPDYMKETVEVLIDGARRAARKVREDEEDEEDEDEE